MVTPSDIRVTPIATVKYGSGNANGACGRFLELDRERLEYASALRRRRGDYDLEIIQAPRPNFSESCAISGARLSSSQGASDLRSGSGE